MGRRGRLADVVVNGVHGAERGVVESVALEHNPGLVKLSIIQLWEGGGGDTLILYTRRGNRDESYAA